MRSIFFLLILVMIGLNGKGQSVTALPDSVLSQCCLEVTLLNGNVTTVDWVFIQYITRDGTGTKLFVEYAPNFGGIQWETQIRIQDDFDDVLERSKFIVIPFTVGSTDYGINRNWIANIEENITTGGTWIYGRFGTPTKRKFSAVEDYDTMKDRLLACRPRAIVVAENGLYTEGDTVRMGGFLIENTTITTEGYDWKMKDTLSSVEFGLDYLTPETGDTTVYWARRSGSLRQMVQLGRRYYYNSIRDTTGGLYSDFTHSWNSGDPFLQYQTFNPSAPTTGTAWFKIQKDNSFLNLSNDSTNPYYSLGWAVTNSTATLGASESGSGDPGNGVVMGAYGFGTTEYLFMKTKAVDAGTATNGQFLQLINSSSGEVDFATIDPVDSSLYATRYWTGQNFFPLEGGTLTGTGGAGFVGFPSQVSAPVTPASGLNIYAQGSSFNWKGTDGFERQFSSTLTGGRTYTLPNTSGTFALGTGTANLVPLWAATNTLGSSNIQDNGTAVSILSSKPFLLGQWTTAGRPTGGTGYNGYNTTLGGNEWYDGTRWNSAPKSDRSAFTPTYIPFTNASGQFTESSTLYFSSNQLYVNSIRIGRGNGAVSQNMAIGEGAIDGSSVTGNFNTAVGWNAMRDLTSGIENMAVGRLALARLTTGNSNVGFGPTALQNLTTGSQNIAIGTLALERAVTVSDNVAIGFSALRFNTGSNGNVAIGSRTLIGQTTDGVGNNVAIGNEALVTSNSRLNVAIGNQAMTLLTSGQENTGIGRFVLRSLTTGSNNVALGAYAGQNETTNSSKLHIANQAAKSLIYGDFSTDQVIVNATWPPTLKSSVALEVISTNKGFLKPVMTNAQRTAISSPATGVEVYQTDGTEGQYVKYASGWKRNLVEGDATWLKTELEAGRDVDVTGASGTDFRLRSNTRVQFDGKFKLGEDSSLIYNPSDKALILTGNAGFQPSFLQVNPFNSFTRTKFEEYDFRDLYTTFTNPKGYNFVKGLVDSRLGTQWFISHKVDSSAALNGWGIINVFGLSYGGAAFQHVFEGGSDEDELLLISRSNISGRRALTVRNNALSSSVFWVTNMGKVIAGTDSTFKFDPATDLLQLSQMGQGNKTAAALGLTESNYFGLSTNGTMIDMERKRDTTIYVVDTDYDFSAALTTAQISRRYNRIIFLMTTTAAAASNSELTLHTPDANLMQCEYLIRSTDEAGGFTNTIQFGSNNAVQSDNTLTGSYTPAPGQGVGIRAGLRSGTYKYYYY